MRISKVDMMVQGQMQRLETNLTNKILRMAPTKTLNKNNTIKTLSTTRTNKNLTNNGRTSVMSITNFTKM